MHQKVTTCDIPRNHFRLDDGAPRWVLRVQQEEAEVTCVHSMLVHNARDDRGALQWV